MKHKERFEARLSKHGATVYINGTDAEKAFLRTLDYSTARMYLLPWDAEDVDPPGFVLYMSADVSLTPGSDEITYDGTSYDVQQTANIHLAETAIAQIVIIANLLTE